MNAAARLPRLSLKIIRNIIFLFKYRKRKKYYSYCRNKYLEITNLMLLWSLIVPHTFIHTVHPHWVYGATLVYWRGPCHHVIPSTAVKAIPSLRQEVVTNSDVVWLYCVVSWSLILIYNRVVWAGIYIFQNNWKN